MADYQYAKSVITSNISTLEERLRGSAEQKGISVSMLTKLIWDNVAEEGMDAVWSELCSSLGHPTAKDKTDICIAICRCLSVDELDGINLFDSGEQTVAGTHGKIAYVRNKRSDDAFLAFSKHIPVAKANYMPSFAEACEAVMDNKCEFCILPVENGNDGKLYSFYSMLDRYDLKICHKVNIAGEDGTDFIGFALAGRSVNYEIHKDDMMRFEFCVVGEGADFISEVLGVADALGGHIASIGTQPVPYDDRSRRCYFAVDLKDGAWVPMALYMNLEYHAYTPLGLYKI
jgi:hypothetical protein